MQSCLQNYISTLTKVNSAKRPNSQKITNELKLLPLNILIWKIQSEQHAIRMKTSTNLWTKTQMDLQCGNHIRPKMSEQLKLCIDTTARGGKFPKAKFMETSSMEISMEISGNFHGYNQDYGNFPPNFWKRIVFSEFQK